MMNTFTAIDFETATGYRTSICQVGLVRVEHGKITERILLLVQPPGNYYWQRFTDDIHGISAENTEDAPLFCEVWPQVAPFIKGQHVVAHNGFAFDFHCLRKTLEYYKIPVPDYTGHCTYKLYQDNLKSLCIMYNITLHHHNALSDAEACAELFLRSLTK